MFRLPLRIVAVVLLTMVFLAAAMTPFRQLIFIFKKGWIGVMPRGVFLQHWIGRATPEIRFERTAPHIDEYFRLPAISWRSNWQDISVPWWLALLVASAVVTATFLLTRRRKRASAFPVSPPSSNRASRIDGSSVGSTREHT
jgi:hypothetical protein